MENEGDQDENSIFNELMVEKERLATEGRYLEANEIKNKINELKRMSSTQKTITLNDYQYTETQKLEEEYSQEYKALNEYWQVKIEQYEDNGRRSEEEMLKIHNANMEELINELTSKYKPIKFSKEYIEMKAIETSLAKQEKFQEAHYYKVKCDKLEQIEMDRYIKRRNESIQIKGESLGYKQANERKVFKQRLETNLDLLQKQREKDIEKLNMKYRNRKNDLDDIHRKQLKITQNENQLRARATAKRISSLIKTATKTTNGSTDLRVTYNNYPLSYSKKSIKSAKSKDDNPDKVIHTNIDFDEKDDEIDDEKKMMEQPIGVPNQNGHIEEDEENLQEEQEEQEEENEEDHLQDLQSHKGGETKDLKSVIQMNNY